MPQFLAPLDLSRNELRNAVFQHLAAEPAAPVNGQFYWDTTLGTPRVYDETAGEWHDLLGAAGTVTDVEVTAPLRSTGGTAPTLSIDDATPASSGAMTGADKTKLDGIAEGATANMADADLLDRANHTGTQSIDTIVELRAYLEDLAGGVDDITADAELRVNKDVPGGYAGLDEQGRLATNALPPLAITDTHLVASEADMVALDAQVGDVAVRTDTSETYILAAEPATDVTNWVRLRTPEGGVSDITTAAPITTTGGATPEIGLADLGVAARHIADQAIGPDKLGAVAGAGLTGGNGSPLALDAAVATRKFSADLAAQASQVITHNLSTRDVQVTVRETAAPFAQVFTDVEMTTGNTVTIRFATAPAAGAFRVTVTG